MKKTLMLSILFLLLTCETAAADWAFSSVVYSGHLYEVTDTEYRAAQIGEKIGEVTFYSDVEGTYGGNFSNTFKAGTEYYAVEGVASEKEIGVKTGTDRFVKAVYRGEYPGGKNPLRQTNQQFGGKVEPHRYGLFASAVVAVILFSSGFIYWRKSRGGK